MKMDRELWKHAKQILHEKYGQFPPVEFVARLESERQELRDTDAMLHIGFMRELSKCARETGEDFVVRGDMGASYAAWLMDATIVNPAPPHTYCPHCRKVIFHPEVRDGLDLPPSRCDCGEELIRDGHDIPYMTFTDGIRENVRSYFELAVTPKLFNQVGALIAEYYQDLYYIVPLVRTGVLFECKNYLLIPIGEEKPKTAPDGTIYVNEDEYWEKYYHYRHYMISVPPPWKDDNVRKHNIRKVMPQKFVTHDVLTAVREKKHEDLMQQAETDTCNRDLYRSEAVIYEQESKQEMRFSLLLQMEGLRHDTGAWQNNGDVLVRGGTVEFMDIPAFRDDIIITIQNFGKLSSRAGDGFAVKIMNDTRKGRYARKGMGEETEHSLIELGLPEWYIRYMKKVNYLFPKDHTIEFLLRDCLRAVD